MFPTKRPLRKGSDLVIHCSTQSVNAVPIHRENFPICHSPALNPTDWEEIDSDEEHESSAESSAPGLRSNANSPPSTSAPQAQLNSNGSTPVGSPLLPSSGHAQVAGIRTSTVTSSALAQLPSSTESAHAPLMGVVLPKVSRSYTSQVIPPAVAHPSLSTPQSSPILAHINLASGPRGPSQPSRSAMGMRTSNAAESRATFPKPQDASNRREKKIRGLEEYMGWFTSSGIDPLNEPPVNDTAEFGDLFVYSFGENQFQVWIRTENGLWERSSAGNDHPYLPGYRLILKNGKPGWVTRKTVATYHYRR